MRRIMEMMKSEMLGKAAGPKHILMDVHAHVS